MTRSRVWSAGASWVLGLLVVLAVPWTVAPGTIQPDTKIDLVLSPWRYLERALSAWNDHTGIGELQNQAHGYLFPMGPFFGVGEWLGISPWVTQRLWWSLLLVVAYVGAERLIVRLDVAARPWSVLGGVAFALSPRVLTLLAEVSSEAWPMALTPWTVLAARRLMAADSAAERLRWVAVSGLLAGAMGGVNATASALALVPAALYLLTADRPTPRWRLFGLWSAGVLAGALWWVGPLLVMGRYAYPFLSFIESGATTTAVASISNVLRGANHWVAYLLTPDEHPVWQSGWILAQWVPAIVGTLAVAGFGLAGVLTLARGHVQRWALTLVLLGVLAMSAGRTGTASGPFSETIVTLLDGPLAPLRNVHKADVLIRLAVSVGLSALVAGLGRSLRGSRVGRRLAPAIVVLALVAAVQPVWERRVGDAWAPVAVPDSWSQVAAVVDASHARSGGTTLLLPASRFAHYSWGFTRDEPLSARATSPVLVRASAPLGHPAATRLLDEIDLLATSGVRQDALADVLARLGVTRVAVRHGLVPAAQAQSADLVEATLGRSPGFTIAGRFGSGATAVSVYTVDRDGPARSTSIPPVRVVGGSESIPLLLQSGLVSPDQPVELDPEGTILTDTNRLRPVNAGRAAVDAYGATTTRDDPHVQPGSPPDFATTRGDLAPARTLVGLASLSASSSGADPFAPDPAGPDTSVYAVVDGDPGTAWASGDASAPASVTLTLHAPHSGTVRVLPLADEAARGSAPVNVVVRADGAEVATSPGPGGSTIATLTAPATVLTVTAERSPRAAPGAPVRIAEIRVDGVDLGAPITLTATDQTTAVLLQRDQRARLVDGRAGEDSAARWSRTVRGLSPAQRWSATALVRPRWGESVDRALDGSRSVTGSSRADLDPAHRPGAALDADPATRWWPADGDARPVLTVSDPQWRGPGRVRISVGEAAGLSVSVTAADGRLVTIPAGEDRAVDLPERSVLTFDGLSGAAPAPEVTLGDAATAPATVRVTCAGPLSLGTGSQRRTFSVTMTRTEVMAGRLVQADPCPRSESPLTAAGTLVMTGTPTASIEAVVLRRLGSDQGPGAQGEEPALLQTASSENDGWVARTPEGHELTPVTIDGWRQGFVLGGADPSSVSVTFSPGVTYRASLMAGAALLGLLSLSAVGLSLVRRRRREHEPVAQPRAGSDGDREHVAQASVGSDAPRLPRGATVALAGLVGLIAAGPVGVLAAAAGAALPVRVRPPTVGALLVALGPVVAALGVAQAFSVGALVGQAAGAVVLGVLAATVLSPGGAGVARGPHGARPPAPASPQGPRTPWRR